MRHHLALFALMLLASSVFGQFDLSHRNLSTENGLPSNTIFDIFQDRSGAVIIAHNKGLVRYNGIEFYPYKSTEKETSLSNIVEVAHHQFLCRNFNDEVFITQGSSLIKIDSLSVKRKGFSTFLQVGKSIFRSRYTQIHQLWDGRNFIYKPIFTVPEGYTLYNLETFNGLLYSDSNDSLFIINPETRENQSIYVGGEPRKFIFSYDNKPALLKPSLGSIQFLGKFNELSDPLFIPHIEKDNKVTLVKQLKNKQLAIGTYAGLYVYDQYFHLVGNYFPDAQISSLMEDQEGNLWIGTLQDGIFIVPSMDIYSLNLNNISLEKASITGIEIINDSCFAIGSHQGKLFFSNATGTIEKVVNFQRKHEIQGMYYSSEKNALYAYCNELFKIDLNELAIQEAIPVPPIKDIFVSGDTIYGGTSVGFYIFVGSGFHEGKKRESWIRKIHPLKDQLLLETASEILSFGVKEQDFIETDITKAISTLGSVSKITLCGDSVYLAKQNQAFLFYKGHVTHITDIPEGYISDLVADKESLYLTNGKTVYYYRQNALKCLDRTKGLTINEIVGMHLFQNHLLVHDNQQIQWFKSFPAPNSIQPTIHLSSIAGSFHNTEDGLCSNYSDNLLQLKWEILPNISALGKAFVRYKLSGPLEEEKILHYTDQGIELERLPYGDYQLELTAYNEDSVASKPVIVSFTIFKPYYATWWFISFIILSMVVLSVLIIRMRIRYLSKRTKEKLEKERLNIRALNAELRAVRNQMNPHFIFNCLSAIQSSILNEESKHAYENLSVFTKLLREALLFTSKEFILLSDELNFIKKYVHLEQMRLSHPFEFNLIIDEAVLIETIECPSLITQPFVENAIRHGLMHQSGDKKLFFEVKKCSDIPFIELIIRDTGVGIDKSKAINREMRQDHQSFGVQAIYDRIELLNENGYKVSLSIDSDSNGTTVSLTLPLKR